MSNKNKILSTEEVEHISNLSRLGLSKEEINKNAQSLADVLGHFAAIQKIDTKNAPASEDVTGLTNITRPDQPKPDHLCSSETLLDYAPEVSRNHIKVKAVF